MAHLHLRVRFFVSHQLFTAAAFMDFQKKYPLLQFPNEHIVIQWERGYKRVNLSYNDRVISKIQGAGKLMKGVKLNDPELGVIELKLSEKPIAINLIVGGYHSPVNVSYPTKELKSASPIFWVLSAMSILGAIYEGVSLSQWYGAFLAIIVTFVNILSIAIYTSTAILIQRGYSWAFFMGASWYSLFTLYYLSDLFLSGIYLDTFFIAAIRIVVTFMFAYYFKYATASIRHKKYERAIKSSNEVLDNFF